MAHSNSMMRWTLAAIILATGLAAGWQTRASFVEQQRVSRESAALTQMIHDSCNLYTTQEIIKPDYQPSELHEFLQKTKALLGVALPLQSLTLFQTGRLKFLGGYLITMDGGPATLLALELDRIRSCFLIFSAGAQPNEVHLAERSDQLPVQILSGTGYRAAIVGKVSEVNRKNIFSSIRGVSDG